MCDDLAFMNCVGSMYLYITCIPLYAAGSTLLAINGVNPGSYMTDCQFNPFSEDVNLI